MSVQMVNGVAPSATSASRLGTAVPSRATDRLLDAATEGSDVAEAAAAAANDADEHRLAGAIAPFGEPDQGMLGRRVDHVLALGFRR